MAEGGAGVDYLRCRIVERIQELLTTTLAVALHVELLE